MSEIVLTTLNARYSHTAFGLRYLMANLPWRAPPPVLLEFDIKHPLEHVAHSIARHNPKILGLGVHIWNAALMPPLVARIRQLLPRTVIVLGGPEISYETDAQPMAQAADYVICGEADIQFAELTERILSGSRPVDQRVISAREPDLRDVQLPYHFYSHNDLIHRITYVETSRGCAFQCDYCISAVSGPLRYFALERILPEFEKLLARGARVWKFVDRTFNLHIERALAILNFFQTRWRPGLILHFEMAPDRFPPELKEAIARFPAGALDLEIGVQTFNPEVAERIRRKQDMTTIEENLRFLRKHTGTTLHVDLMVGLPGETWDSIRAGFDRLVALRPHRIQLGILKRLRGAPISRHDAEWQMKYDTDPPYAIRSSRVLSSEQIQRMVRMAKFWERVANREQFPRTMERLRQSVPSVWDFFMGFSDWFFERYQTDHGIALRDLTEAVFDYATRNAGVPRGPLAEDLAADYAAAGRRRDTPRLKT